MENYLYNSFKSFYNARKTLGYINDKKVESLLIMTFIYRLIYFDYRAIIPEEQYMIIMKAISCLEGSNCLLPYKDYLKMGKLHIGEFTELAHKLSKLDNSSSTSTEELESRVSSLENDVTNTKTKVTNLETKVTEIEDTTKEANNKITKNENDIVTIKNKVTQAETNIRTLNTKSEAALRKIANLENIKADERLNAIESVTVIKS